MRQLLTNIRIFSSFWILLACYFLIPLFIQSIETPEWIYSIDSKIPFQWWMIIPYYMYYIVIILPPIIWKDEWKIRNVTSILNIMTFFCYIFFIIWPISANDVLNQVPDKQFPLKILHDMITYDYLYQNAFPSMHVVVSWFLCLAYYHDFKKFKFIALAIGILIFFATFLIKQHYLFDSLLGLVIGSLGFFYYLNEMKIYK